MLEHVHDKVLVWSGTWHSWHEIFKIHP
jgi:hypothetical protein